MRPETQMYSTTRSYILAFANEFADLFVVRYDEEGEEWKFPKVPVVFPFTEKWFAYQKNKWLARADMNPDYLFEISKNLPVITLGEFKLSYNIDNQHNKYEKLTTPENGIVPTPVSYFLDTTVGIYTKILDDNYQILEQILPFFAPSYNINVNLPLLSLNESVPISLTDVSETIPIDVDVESKKLIQTELSFRIKVNYYPDKITAPEEWTKEVIIK